MSPPRHPNVTPSILPGTSGFSQQEYSSLLRSMDGGGQHSQGHIVDFLSQQSNNDTGMPLFNQSLSSPAAHGVPVRHDNSINLNMQMAESSHMSLYQQYVQGATPDMRSGQQGVVRGRGVNSGHGGVPLPRRATSAGGATSNAGAPFCAPRTITAPTKRGRAPSSSNTQADGDTGTPQGSSNAAASEAQEDEDDPSMNYSSSDDEDQTLKLVLEHVKAKRRLCTFACMIGKFYLVDSGYPNRPGYLAPYRGTKYHLPEYRKGPRPRGKKEVFNFAHSSLRNVIERCFGVLKMKWRILLHLPSFSQLKQSQIILVCMALHNFIRESEAADPDFEKVENDENFILESSSAQQSGLNNQLGDEDQDMNTFRDYIADNLIGRRR